MSYFLQDIQQYVEVIVCFFLLKMVAPKKSVDSGKQKQDSDGDKSPSPEPFREPEGLVSIDLYTGKKHRKSSKTPSEKEVDYKKKVFKILVLVFIFNIIILMVFAVLVYLNEERYLFKTKPLSIPVFNDADDGPQMTPEESTDPLADMIIRCLDQNSLSECCDLFKNAETSFNLGEWCELDHMMSSMDIDIRRKRELKSRTLPQSNDIVDKITDFVLNDVPITTRVLRYTDHNNHDQPVYYDYDYDDPSANKVNNVNNENDMVENNEYADYGYRDEPLSYQGYPMETENHRIFHSQPSITPPPLPYGFDQQPQNSENNDRIFPEILDGLITDESKRIHGTPNPKTDHIVNNWGIISPGTDSEKAEITTEYAPYSVSLNLDFPEEQLSSQSTVIDELEISKDNSTRNNYPDVDSSRVLDYVDASSEMKPTSTYDEFMNENYPKDETTVARIESSGSFTVSPTEIITFGNTSPQSSREDKLDSIYSSDSKQLNSNNDLTELDSHKESDSNLHQTTTTVAGNSYETVLNYEQGFQSAPSISFYPDGLIDSNHNEQITESIIYDLIDDNVQSSEGSSTTMHSTAQSQISNDPDLNMEDTSDKHRANEAEDNRPKIKSEFFSPTVEMQSNPQAMFNPCLGPYPNPFYNPYKMAQPPLYDGSQIMKVIPSNNQKATQFVLNPPMYPYMQQSYLPNPQFMMPSYWQQPLQQTQSSNPIQVSGPGGQFYVCNPIPPVTNNVASMTGIEIRRQSSNLQDMLAGIKEEFKTSNRSREALTICPLGQQSCDDGSKCVPRHHVCDNEAHCDDGSDEMVCTCKDRVGKLRTCDGYFDCPDGQDELGCFGCNENEFSCDDWSRFRKSTCIPIEHRCDGIRQCEITGKDEEDCSVLADNVGNQPQFKISNSVGFLHRNYKGKWYPTCFGTDLWATEICQTESGPTAITPKSHMMLTTNKYDGNFVNILPNDNIHLVKNCVQDRAAFVECPPLFCGLRMTIKNPYRPQEVDTSVENVIDDLERGAESRKENVFLGNPRVVGGKPSQPAAWPWLVSIYKNGIFHCGGVLINEMWIVTAAHCVDKFWLYYYEIQAGMLRRFSYAPMEQHRWASIVIPHENYDKSTLGSDLALMKLSSAVRFNRYVRPICLPSEATAGRSFVGGPIPGTICTTVGWGATVEHGSDPDHMREVEVPVLSGCKHPDDRGGEEICAGLSEGGRDACQGDSGGPLMCRNPNNPSQWYLAGIVSHGEGCARPDEPGVYTKVSKYVGWIAENIGSGRFFSSIPLQSCPGYICKFTNQCLPKKHHCDKIVDCLFGDDESSCKHSFHNIFNHARKNRILRKMRKGTEEDETNDSSDSKNAEKPNVDSATKAKMNENLEKILEQIPENIKTGTEVEGVDRTAASILVDIIPPKTEMKTNKTQDSNNSHENWKHTSSQNHNFSCNSFLQMIPMNKKCDKVVDCEDGSDEDSCACADYIKNTNPAAICDGITDCFDESDEMNCSTCNTTTNYHCRQSKECIPLIKRCDGVADCSKTEDEWDCAALTNGQTLTLDSDLRPELAMSGIITINRFGVWRPFCSNMTGDEASIVTNVCNLLGFEEYVDYHKYLVGDRPIEVQKNASERQKRLEVEDDLMKDKDGISNASSKCSGLTVRCSVISLDKSVHAIRPDNVADDVELYTSPWNAVIYSDGIYRCMGTILDQRWIITSVNCFKGITTIRWHYTTVLVGTGKAQLHVRGPHEQTFRVVETIGVPNSDIILLGTDNNITFTRYVKNAVLDLRRDGRRRERCIAIGLHRGNAKYIVLTPIEFCYVGFRCFESNAMKDCEDSEPWSGTIVCDSSNGWYPAAVFHESLGPCGLTAVKKYTSIPFYKRNILSIMQHVPTPVDAPPCDGFRCALGKCITKNKTCDGIPDCRNGDDEAPILCYDKNSSCHLGNNTCECPLTHLKCKNGKCVPKSTFCDSNNDCGDNSDEPSNCSCRAYLQLTDPRRVCDGSLHCLDRSDEDPQFCACRRDDFNCLSVEVCVSNDMVCDGIEDCPNGEDEKVCYDLSSARGRRSNAGEVLKQTAGKWHKGCFNMTHNSTELDKVCEKLGFFNSSSIQLKPPQDNDNMTTLRPVIDHFDTIWIHRNQSDKFSMGIRKGNRPYVNFVPDDHCYRLFVACL